MKKLLTAFLCFSLVLSSSGAHALPLNICKRLLQDAFIPPIYESVYKCNVPSNTFKKIAFCGLLPQCCFPGLCLSDPACYVTLQTLKVAGYWKYVGDLDCSIKDIEPSELLKQLLAGEIENALDLVTGDAEGPIIEATNIYIDALLSSSMPIPDNWKSLLRQYVTPIYDDGNTGFSTEDVDNVRMTAGDNSNYFFFLTEGMGGVTLGPVIIIKTSTYDDILNYTGDNLQELVSKGSYKLSYALDLLAHELVHVKQFRVLGRETFIKNYYLRFIASGNPLAKSAYYTNSFEQEAYRFTAKMVQFYGGSYCRNMKEDTNRHIDLCELSDVQKVTCQ